MDWTQILKNINGNFLKSHDSVELKNWVDRGILAKEVLATKWLGRPAAQESDINAIEKKLGTALPQSYKQFLKTSNGFMNPTSLVDELLSVDKISWLRDSE